MDVSRVISVPSWDGATADAAAQYWRSRGFAAVRIEDTPTVRGTRGSATDFAPFYFFRSGAGFFDVDWRKIRAALTMVPGEFGGVRVDVSAHWVGTGVIFPMTEWAPAFLRMEISELEHILNGAGNLAEVWEAFTEAERRGTSRWLWTRKFGGRGKLPEEWEDRLLALEARFLLA